MKELKLLCWNVNGLRAVANKGFLEWLQKEKPDVLCLQETKAQPGQLDQALREPEGYHGCWSNPGKKGYGGVATYTREKPLRVETDFSREGIAFDVEGRIILTDYPGFTLMNIYFPNGKKDETRLQYKMDFYEAFLRFAESLRKKYPGVIVCGDFNTAHKEIDLARPKENQKISGFLPMERAWMDRFVARGWVDTFRQFHPEPGQYSWWDLKSRARERNVGWRIDYFFVSKGLAPSVAGAFIMPEVTGSDHCPVGMMLRLP
jgi:exodeoxyribonuclease III